MRLSSEERETIIRFDDSENVASIYTCNSTLKSKLDKLMSERTGISIVSEDEYSKTYILPKKWVKVVAPRILSDEQRSKMAEKAKELWKKRNINISDKIQA